MELGESGMGDPTKLHIALINLLVIFTEMIARYETPAVFAPRCVRWRVCARRLRSLLLDLKRRLQCLRPIVSKAFGVWTGEGTMRGRRAITVVLLAGPSLLAACSSNNFEEPFTPSSAQRAATVHISPLSIDRWEDFVGPLQAQFTMTADGAVALALPKTSVAQNSIAELFSAGVQVGLTASQPAPGTTATAPTAPASPLPALTQPNAAAATYPSGPIAPDPILTYSTASAIYQEIQLLNRYLNSAALHQDYKPYIVRLQVSVSPLARNEPYDTIVDLGLFAKCRLKGRDRVVAADSAADSLAADSADDSLVKVIPLIVTDDIETGQVSNALNIARQLNATLSAVAASPIIQGALLGSVSDLRSQYKAILGSQYNSLYSVGSGGSENVIQVRLGAARNPNLDTAHSTGYSMQTQSHNVSFLALVNKGFVPNRAGNCSGDARSPDARSPTVDSESSIWITSHTRFRSVATGTDLDIDRNLILQDAQKLLARFVSVEYPKPLDSGALAALFEDIQTNKFSKFTLDAKPLFRPTIADSAKPPAKPPAEPRQPPYEALWTALTSIIGMSEYAGATLALPIRSIPPIDERQTLFLHDNCKDAATVTIAGAGSLSPSNFSAILQWIDGTEVAATAIAQSSPGGPFSLQFPSLAPLAELLADKGNLATNTNMKSLATNIQIICPNSSNAAPSDVTPAVILTAKLFLQEVLDTRWNPTDAVTNLPRLEKLPGRVTADYTFTHVIYDKSTPPDTSVALVATADTITADQTGLGSIRLLVKLGKALNDVALTVSGASLAPSASSVSTQTAGAVTVVNGGIKVAPAAASVSVSKTGPNTGQVVFDVPLQGLVAGRAVTFLATGEAISAGDTSPKAVGGSTATVSVSVVPFTANGSKPATPGTPAGGT